MSILRLRKHASKPSLNLAGESGAIFREIEHEFYLEVGKEFSAILRKVLYPSTMVDDEKYFQISPNFVVEEIQHITQVGVYEDGVRFRVRRIIDKENDIRYVLCVKVAKNGTRLETESDILNCDDSFAKSAFLLLHGSAEQYQVKTRLSIAKFANNDKIKVDIDIPLLEGFSPYTKPKWGKYIKVDIEHDGTLGIEEALRLIDIPYLKIITNKEEISNLNKNIFNRTNNANVKYLGDMILEV